MAGSQRSRASRERFVPIGCWNGEFVVVGVVSPLGNEEIDVVSLRRARVSISLMRTGQLPRGNDGGYVSLDEPGPDDLVT